MYKVIGAIAGLIVGAVLGSRLGGGFVLLTVAPGLGALLGYYAGSYVATRSGGKARGGQAAPVRRAAQAPISAAARRANDELEAVFSVEWSAFEQWVRDEIGGDFIWKERAHDTPERRQLISDSIHDAMKNNHGVFPEANALIERVQPRPAAGPPSRRLQSRS